MAPKLSALPAAVRRDLALLALLGLAAAGFYVTPWPPAYALFFLALAGLTFLRLDLALALIPMLAPFFMQPKYLGHLTFVPTELLIGLDCAVAVVLFVLRREPLPSRSTLRRSPFLVPICVFLLAVTASTLLASDRHLALHAYRERVLDPLAYFALLLLYVRDRRGWTYILAALVAAGALVGVIGLGQLALHRDLSAVPGTSIERVQALYGSPDNLGLLLDRVVPFWFAVALVARFGRQFRLLWWAVGVVLVIVLLLTFSVGAWIAVALSCLLVLALARPWGRWVAVACILVVAAGIGVKSHSVARAFNSGHANSTQTRLWVWQSSLHMLHDRPVLGIGPDNFQRYYAPTRRQDRWQRVCVPGRGYMEPGAGAEPCLSHPHDEFLDFWLSAGVLGLVSYLWLLYVFWNVAIRLGSRARFRDDRAAILGTMAAMAASVIHGLIDNSYFLVDLSLLFWLLCAFFSWMWTDGQAADEWPAPVEMRLDRDENARTTALTRAFRHFPVRRFAYRAERRRLEAVP